MKREEIRIREPQRASDIGRTVGAFTLGATIGGVIALLFAPASGKVTRRRIAMKVRALRQQAGRQLGRTKKLLARKAEDLREVTTEKLHDAREWVTGHLANGNGKRPTRHRAVRHA